MVAALALIAVILAAPPGLAADGDLDPSFGVSGKATATPFASGPATTRRILVQADGRIVTIGMFQGQIALARFESDGSLDPSFGSAGVITTPVGVNATGEEGAVLSDGRIVIVGSAQVGGVSRAVIARYDANGALDMTFGVGGIVAPPPIAGEESGVAILLQPDDKTIVVVGSLRGLPSNETDTIIRRYDTSGTLDPTFGSSGEVVVDGGEIDDAWTAALQPDGGILLGGMSGVDFYSTAPTVSRYLADGSPDSAFGVSGLVTFAPGEATVSSLALRADGRIVALARGGTVAQLLPDGSFDPAFGQNGLANADRFGLAFDLVIDPSGRPVIAGGFLGNPSLVRFTSVGQVDPTLSSCVVAAVKFFPISPFGENFASVAVQADGRYLAAGIAGAAGGGFPVVRFGTPSPVASCAPAAPAGADLRIGLFSNRPGWKLKWKWRGASPGDSAQFGAPPAGDDHVTCVLGAGAATPHALVVVPGGDACGEPECWSATSTGFTFHERIDGGSFQDGSLKVKLQAPADVSPQIRVTFAGVRQPEPLLPFVAPLIVRYARVDGAACWEANYSAFQRNDSTRLRGRSD